MSANAGGVSGAGFPPSPTFPLHSLEDHMWADCFYAVSGGRVLSRRLGWQVLNSLGEEGAARLGLAHTRAQGKPPGPTGLQTPVCTRVCAPSEFRPVVLMSLLEAHDRRTPTGQGTVPSPPVSAPGEPPACSGCESSVRHRSCKRPVPCGALPSHVLGAVPLLGTKPSGPLLFSGHLCFGGIAAAPLPGPRP